LKREPDVPDPEAVRSRGGDYQEELTKLHELRELDEQPIVQCLRSAGWMVSSVWDLVNARYNYDGAIPILLHHLSGDYYPSTKETIARALTLKGARPVAAKPLITEFLSHNPQSKSEEHSKWAIGNALALTGDDSAFDSISAILRDKSHGWTRSGMILSLPNMRKRREDAFQLALELAGDEDASVSNLAMIALGDFRDIRARPVVESFLQHSDSWVRKKAKQALAKIDRRASRGGQTKPH
jgi:hypothetical protein